MTIAETYSWLLYATWAASRREAARQEAISSIADGINHAVLTQREMQASFAWLTSNGFIIKEGRKYRTTPTGDHLIEAARSESKAIRETVHRLTQMIAGMGVDNEAQINPRTMNTEPVVSPDGFATR